MIEDREPRRRLLSLVLAVVWLLQLLPIRGISRVRAEGESPYRVTEFPIRVAVGRQTDPLVAGKWVIWNDDGSDAESKQFSVRNLETGQNYTIVTENNVYWPVVAGGDVLVTLEHTPYTERGKRFGEGIFLYRLPDGQRIDVTPFADGTPFGPPHTDGRTVVWTEETASTRNLYTYNLETGRRFMLPVSGYYAHYPKISGNIIVWQDMEFEGSSKKFVSKVSGYDLAADRKLSITTKPEEIDGLVLSGNLVVWLVRRDNAAILLAYDTTKEQEFRVAQLPLATHFDVNGSIVVWSVMGDYDRDIFGYDLRLQQQFTISRAIGDQTSPRISGNTVVWVDTRGSGASRLEYDTNIYGARLDPGPAPVPPVIGAPSAADGKIEVVWPQGKPVTEADKANIGAWIFLSDTLKLVPCQWNPKVQLWRAINNEPARQVATGVKEGDHFQLNGSGVPTWDFNDIDVSAARDPRNEIYFFVTVEGTSTRSNVWAHGIDSRTYFPQQDMPTGLKEISGAIDAKIEAVWPHDNAPVDRADKVNITASLFAPGTLLSAPADWSPTVRLYRSLNNDISQQVAIGNKRLVRVEDLTYPVWDFNDIDVSAANDLANKYYFTLSVDEVVTNSNVWSHGADARTYFPQMDTPTQNCG